jgi:hypothetical protein
MLGITAEEAESLIKLKNTGLTWAQAASQLGLAGATGVSTGATIA